MDYVPMPQRPVAAQLGLRRHLSARRVRAVCAAISQLSAALHPCRGSLLALHLDRVRVRVRVRVGVRVRVRARVRAKARARARVRRPARP